MADEAKKTEEAVAETKEEKKAEEATAETKEEEKAEEATAEAKEEKKTEEAVAETKEEKKAEEAAAETKEAAKPKAAKADKPKKSAALDNILTAIKGLTIVELAELVKAMEEEFGVSAAAPVAVAAAAPAAEAGGAAETEEQTEFSIILKEVGANKINVIKAVRELTTLGLKESKDLVESAPKPVKEGITKEEAANAKQKLEAAGATAEVK